MFSDQPTTGLKKSIWWIEYVLRHKGAKHLRSSAADMSLIEYYLLDVIALVLFIFSLLVYSCLLVFKITRMLIVKHINKLKKE